MVKNNTGREKVLTPQKPVWSWKNSSEYQSQINFRISHQISWTLHDLLKSFKTKYNRRVRGGWVVLHISLTLGWLALIKFDIKSNANLLLKAMQKRLSQPMFTPRSIFMWTYIYASADDLFWENSNFICNC